MFKMSNKLMEQEADYFARCLLMPKKLIEQNVTELNNPSVKELAKIFEVSIPQMTIRLNELGYRIL